MIFIEVKGVLKYTPLVKSKPMLDKLAKELNKKSITSKSIQRDFAIYLSKVLKDRVENSIRTQRFGHSTFKSMYKPLSEKYRKSKPWGTKGKFWVNTYFLVDNLQVWRRGDKINIGFKRGFKHPKSDTPLNKIVEYLEKGTKSIPPRPIFYINSRYISRHIRDYFNHFLKIRYGII